MPIDDILFLTAVVSAFIAFGVVLGWGEYQTRNISRRDQRIPRKSGQEQSCSPKDADRGGAVNADGGAMNESTKWTTTKAERTAANFG